jgi:Toprim domain
MAAIDLGLIDQLTSRRLGTFDVPCPMCGPTKRGLAKQRKRVLRVWRMEDGFATYCCRRCGLSGYAHDCHSPPTDPVKLAEARKQAAEHDRITKSKRLQLARWLWRRREPLLGSVGEVYLREARWYKGTLPATLGYLPPYRDHAPALIAAFGFATEIDRIEHQRRWEAEHIKPLAKPSPEDPKAIPWTGGTWLPDSLLHIADADVVGVHVIKLRPDGSDRLRDIEDAKITVGKDFVAPIMLAPVGDLLALTIAEGVEDVLTDHDLTGRGAWAAASAGRMPSLAEVVPSYVETVTVLVDDNAAGRAGSAALADALYRRGIEVLMAGGWS